MKVMNLYSHADDIACMTHDLDDSAIANGLCNDAHNPSLACKSTMPTSVQC